MTTPEDVQQDYTSRLEAIAATVAAAVVAIYAALLAGRLVRSVAAEAIALVVAQGNSAAAALADLHVADILTAATGTPVLARGITRPDSDVPRLTAAAETVIDRAQQRVVEKSTENIPDGTGEVERLAKSEPMAAASEAEGKAVDLSGVVVAYRRSLSPGACDKCIAWAEGGREFPKKAPFKRHNGCSCTRELITLEDRNGR